MKRLSLASGTAALVFTLWSNATVAEDIKLRIASGHPPANTDRKASCRERV